MLEAKMSVRRAGAELTVASVFWGFGFIAALWALKSMGPLWITGLRFTTAFLFTLPIMILWGGRKDFLHLRDNFKLSFWPGIFLALTIVFQTWGLLYTTATNSGFITTLYVLFVPMLEAFLFRKRLELIHFLLVVVALGGTALICQWHASQWNFGDFLTLLCALASTAQIVTISRLATKISSPFFFNNFQAFWAGTFSLILALIFEPFRLNNVTPLPITGFLFLLFGSTLVAFFIQVRAQRVLSANSASLICLLESPFAALFAFWLLEERLTLSQWSGAMLIFFSAIYSLFLESQKHREMPNAVQI